MQSKRILADKRTVRLTFSIDVKRSMVLYGGLIAIKCALVSSRPSSRVKCSHQFASMICIECLHDVAWDKVFQFVLPTAACAQYSAAVNRCLCR